MAQDHCVQGVDGSQAQAPMLTILLLLQRVLVTVVIAVAVVIVVVDCSYGGTYEVPVRRDLYPTRDQQFQHHRDRQMGGCP